jgi:hypothetical protein
MIKIKLSDDNQTHLVHILLYNFRSKALGRVQRSAVRPLGIVALPSESDFDAGRAEHFGREDRGDATKSDRDT